MIWIGAGGPGLATVTVGAGAIVVVFTAICHRYENESNAKV